MAELARRAASGEFAASVPHNCKASYGEVSPDSATCAQDRPAFARFAQILVAFSSFSQIPPGLHVSGTRIDAAYTRSPAPTPTPKPTETYPKRAPSYPGMVRFAACESSLKPHASNAVPVTTRILLPPSMSAC